MTRQARQVLPTDLLALVAHNGRVFPNEAKTRERIGSTETPSYPLDTALDRWLSFMTGRNTWISANGPRLQGLVSTRRRGGRQAWEVNTLIDTTKAFDATPGLLNCATAEAARAGADKIFVRLTAESPLLPVVRDSGFTPYSYETLYVAQGLELEEDGVEEMRPFSPQDLYPAFLLYNCLVPETVRRSEAATFSEWHSAQERQWLRDGVQLVGDGEGRLSSWVRAAHLPQGTLMDLLIEDRELERLGPIIAAAGKAAGGEPPYMVLAPQCAIGLGKRLSDLGFEQTEEFVSLVHRTRRPMELKSAIPAIGKTAVVA